MPASPRFEPMLLGHWPEARRGTILSARRMSASGDLSMWTVTHSQGVYRVERESSSKSSGWLEPTNGPQFASIGDAVGSDIGLVSLHPDEITLYQVDASALRPYDLASRLECVGASNPAADKWPLNVAKFWTESDLVIENAYNGYECTHRWASINEYRISCVRFEDATPLELIPALFDRDGDLVDDGEVGMAEFHTEYMPVCWDGSMSLLRLRSGYALARHTGDAQEIMEIGPSHLMRLPIDPAEETVAIDKWQRSMDKASGVEDENNDDDAED